MVHASPTIHYTVLFMTKTQRLSSGQKLQIDSLSATVYVSHIDVNFGAIAWLPKLFGMVAMYLATTVMEEYIDSTMLDYRQTEEDD